MLDFIQDAAGKLGIGEDTAKSATGGLLGLIQEHADPADASEMLSKLPGAAELIPSGGDSGGGGLLGGLGDALGGALGGGAGGALGAVEALSKTGLSADKLGSFLELFKNFALPKLGPDLLQRLLGKIPGLGSLLG
ncbi:MAG: hypothetical protein QNJ90_04420 [Planctomycetota bacterium]|nr:hypothetical protein [Planctomycetota bacterium]